MGKQRPAPDTTVVLEARRAGLSVVRIAARLDCSETSVRKILEREGLVTKNPAAGYGRPEPTLTEMALWCLLHLQDLHREHGDTEGMRA